MDKQDRRVRKTREAIKEAFLDLIAARGFDALTVQDVSDAADINRSTFYAHFQDKFDLLDRTIREVLEKLVEDIRPEQMLRLPWMAYRGAKRILLTLYSFVIFESINGSTL